MKTTLLFATLCSFAIAPSIGFACEYNDASMASASTPERLGLQAAAQASKAPAAVVDKAAPKVARQAPTTSRTPANEAKIAAATPR